MNFTTEAHQLLTGLDNRLSPSAYDIAWLARLWNDSTDTPCWEDTVAWLIENQWEDGSWGGTIPYYHDRILCTLAGILAFTHNGLAERYPKVIQKAQAYLWGHLHLLHHDLMELVGFELIIPTLLEELHYLKKIPVPSHSYGYGTLRDNKLSIIPLDLVYSPNTSLAFSLEFLGEHPAVDKMSKVLAEHGAIANSPATTAYYALYSGDTRALQFLELVQQRQGGVPAFYPFRDFELAWVLQHLAYSGVPTSDYVPDSSWEQLLTHLTPKGIGIDPLFGINDGDTTSVTLHALARGGHYVDPRILHVFEHPQKRIFQTFFFERNMSVITNIHALEALAYMPDYPDRDMVVTNIIISLLDHRRYETFWIDKWHISPYYATAHALIALIEANEGVVVQHSNTLEWFIHTQRRDGSWGYFDRGTSEETAYVLLALLYYHEQLGRIDKSILRRGIDYLLQHRGEPHPELWIAKTLYTPHDIVESAILATLTRYEHTIGRL